MPDLHAHLQRLLDATDTAARVARDPVSFVRPYGNPLDAEIAGVFASQLAYGRADLFRPTVARILARADAMGGPRSWVESLEPERELAQLGTLVYRLQRGPHLVALAAGLGRLVRELGSVEAAFEIHDDAADVRSALITGVERLRAAVIAEAPACGLDGSGFSALPRGLRFLLSHPGGGSAVKRWNMYLRWMVRPADGVDLGLWTAIRPAQLVMPMDTHTTRLARFAGLTRRTDGSWRTAVEVTAALRQLDPHDPVRFDFALAHLGISGQCRGRWVRDVCPACPIAGVCIEARPEGTNG